MKSLRSHRGIHLFLLFSFLSTPVAEGGELCSWWILRTLGPSPSCQRKEKPEETVLQVEWARKAWLKKFGRKWGLNEDSPVQVVCGCTCCGERCPMGAACCCAAPKYPVPENARVLLRGPGCNPPGGQGPPSPVSTSWIYLLKRSEPSVPRGGNGVPFDRALLSNKWTPTIEPPPPREERF